MLRRLAILLFALSCLAPAKLLRIELSERSDVLDGASFGAAGPYERLIGKAYFGVDPNLPANKIIVDIALAPRDAEGLVEFSADLYVLKPRDPAKGNHAMIFEVSNRGGKGMLGVFNRAAPGTDPRTDAQLGDKLLMQQGYTIAWLGWQFDVPNTPGLLRLDAPIAKDNGKTITGLVRSEFVPDARTPVMGLADRGHVPYPMADVPDAIRELTVRDTATGPRKAVDKKDWNLRNGKEIYLEKGFEPGKFYELVYLAKDPVVVGLGPAAIRDFVSFIKYNGVNTITVLGEQNRHIKQVYGFGISQSGRFLRKYIYDGFNGDEQGRKVFDGLMVHVGGAGRGSFNHRFAQPSRDGHPYLNVLYPTDLFPFTDLPETDPETGRTGALLGNTNPKNVPKIFYTNSSYEYWGRSAALIHTTPDGKADAQLAPTTRVYMFAGGQHGPAPFPPRKNGTVNASNPNDYRWALRALLTAMDAWVKTNTPPPDSVYPHVAKAELTAPKGVKLPQIPGQKLALRPKLAWDMDFGSDFETKGIVTQEPPLLTKTYPALVPQVDADGIDLGGIRMPEVAVPLATYLGWNLRDASLGAPEELFSMQGSFIPFPLKKTPGDSRTPVAERYKSKQDYLDHVAAAAVALVKQRFLLPQDVDKQMERANLEWAALVK